MAHGNTVETMSLNDDPFSAGAAGTAVTLVLCFIVAVDSVGVAVVPRYMVRTVEKPGSSKPVTVLGPLPEESVSEACGE